MLKYLETSQVVSFRISGSREKVEKKDFASVYEKKTSCEGCTKTILLHSLPSGERMQKTRTMEGHGFKVTENYSYEDGEKHGKAFGTFSDARVKKEWQYQAEYSHGELHGEAVRWQGNKILMKATFIKGKLQEAYCKNSRFLVSRRTKENVFVSTTSLFSHPFVSFSAEGQIWKEKTKKGIGCFFEKVRISVKDANIIHRYYGEEEGEETILDQVETYNFHVYFAGY
ncbi:hypothetical protein D1R32_gp393 [Tunisvirus fontaine2]|uniref:MORN repeat-containing protein n=1 Tax=Tunisvirus fontaine2 TaxID=1421067 RepID=V9SEG6_9VIRU|nr:hypothetical protein D1R32_gp393 [Tunisvirus fontaine2]AHC55110.1 hypothetical protein TNS_ORF392 [Tunisvirus fontaine2]